MTPLTVQQLRDYLDFAQALAIEAGQFAAASFGMVDARRKFDGSLVTLIDEQTDHLVADAIRAAPEGTRLLVVGSPRAIADPKDHLELGESLGLIDMARGAKVSGSRFYFLTGRGALLQLGLLQLAVRLATENGFTLMIPPVLVRPEVMAGTGFLGAHADEIYRLATRGTKDVVLIEMLGQIGKDIDMII